MIIKRNKKEIKRCRDCRFSYDYHKLGVNGEPIMCKCAFSQFKKVLSDPACDRFKEK